MSRKARMTHKRVTAKFPTNSYDMRYEKNWLENAVAGNSVGKSEVELRAQRAYALEGLVTALAVDVAKELKVLSAMDIETIDPGLHVETMTAVINADEYVNGLLSAIDEIKRKVAQTPNDRRQFGIRRRKRTEKDKKCH
jgi:hypothetical protein